MDIEGSFGGWLKRRRKALDLTQGELAQQIGCSTVMIGKLESEERRPSKQIAEKLGARLGVPVEELGAFLAWARAAHKRDTQPPVTHQAAEQRIDNLPAPPTALIGRNEELAALKQHLLTPQSRLVTLVGPPGVGKTHLALQAAAELREVFADGVCFVALAPVADGELVAPTIAQALGLAPADRTQPALVQLILALRGRGVLLLLDNFEQLLPAASAVGDLLAACPLLTVLVTSRSPLQLPGEQQFPLAPLPLPRTAELASAASLAASPAVALFVARARAVNPGFALSDEHAPAVAALCTRLDGLPLAIELIAARCKLLPPAALLERLDDAGKSSLRLLARGPHTLPPRQQTLYNAIRWSYDLLSPSEQCLFTQLAVFTGGWTIAAAEAVCADGKEGPVLEGLESLLDKSLIVHQVRPDGAPRLTMLEMVRAYALEHLLSSGAAEGLRQRHAGFYQALAEEAEPHLKGGQQRGWLERLEGEHANLRAALRWAVDTRDGATAARLSGALWRFWLIRGHLAEGRAWLAETLALDPPPERSDLRAKALNGAGVLAWSQGDHNAAQTLYDQSLALYRSADDQGGSATVLNNLGLLARSRSEYTAAQHHLEACLALRRALGDTWGSAVALLNLGLLAQEQRDYAGAVGLYEQSLELYRALGSQTGIANVLDNLGQATCYQGDYGRAAAFHEESLALYRELKYKMGIGTTLSNLGLVARRQGLHQEAAGYYRESLLVCQELDYQERIAEGLEGLAAIAVAQGHQRHAAWLLGCAERIRETSDTPLTPTDRAAYESLVADLRAQLPAVAFRTAWDNGRAMSAAQAIAALDRTPHPAQSSPAAPAADAPVAGDRLVNLTPREIEVLRLVARGLSNPQIADLLIVSTSTVNAHLRTIFSKLDVTSRSAATRYAIEHGIA